MRWAGFMVALLWASAASAQVVTWSGTGPFTVMNGNGVELATGLSVGSFDLSSVDEGDPANAEISVWNGDGPIGRSWYWNYGPQAGNGLWFDVSSGTYVESGGGEDEEEGGGWPGAVPAYLDTEAALSLLELLMAFLMPLFLVFSIGIVASYLVFRVFMRLVGG